MENMNRRKFMKGVGTATLGATLFTSNGVARSSSDAEIPESLARRLARYRINQVQHRKEFSKFDPEGLGNPELFYAARDTRLGTDYIPAAWVFPIKNGRKEVGHISVGAHKFVPPIIQYGTAKAPQNYLEDKQTDSNVSDLSFDESSTYLYKNPMAFGIEAEGRTFVDLKRGFRMDDEATAGFDPSQNVEHVQNEWQRIKQFERKGDLIEQTPQPLSSEDVSGSVPNWTEEDDGNANTSYPDCAGMEPDPWASWDGCVPIATSMVNGYHVGYEDSWPDDIKENYIDTLHEVMNTRDLPTGDGQTFPFDIPNIEDEFSYDVNNHWWGRRDEIKDQIDSNNPPVVSYWGDKSSSSMDLKDKAVGHAEVAHGYVEGDNPWWDPTDPPLYVTTNDGYGSINELRFGTDTTNFFVTSIEPTF